MYLSLLSSGPTLGRLTPPESLKKSFTCPHCQVLARHYHWGYAGTRHATPLGENQDLSKTTIRASLCEHCDGLLIWHEVDLIYPRETGAPPPNEDMPAEVKKDYSEAALIVESSPRGAAALLRLAIQKLCKALGEKGKNLNTDIGSLVKKGLPEQVQQALDVVRVTGNNAVHPGQIETDDSSIVAAMFPLVNIIVEHMVSMPKRVDSLYNSLPNSSLDAIKNRDDLS